MSEIVDEKLQKKLRKISNRALAWSIFSLIITPIAVALYWHLMLKSYLACNNAAIMDIGEQIYYLAYEIDSGSSLLNATMHFIPVIVAIIIYCIAIVNVILAYTKKQVNGKTITSAVLIILSIVIFVMGIRITTENRETMTEYREDVREANSQLSEHNARVNDVVQQIQEAEQG